MIRKSLSILLIAVIFFPALWAGSAQAPQESDHLAEIELLKSDTSGLLVALETRTYDLKDVIAESKSYQQITLPGADLTSDPGKPQIPVMVELIGIPPIGDAELIVVKDERKKLEGDFHLAPAPSPKLNFEDLRPGEWIRIKDMEVYNQDAFYPSHPVQLGDEAWLRNQRMVPIEFYPFQYNPATGELIWHNSLEVEIRFRTGEKAPESPDLPGRRADPFGGVLDTKLLNYEDARYLRSPALNTQFSVAEQGDDQLPGPRYKISISEDGIYKLTYDVLKSVGLVIEDPASLRMTSQGQEIAIYVSNTDGDSQKFSPGEYILFYGQAFDGELLAERYQEEDLHWYKYFETQTITGAYTSWAPEINAATMEKYTDENVYWLSYGGVSGQRMEIESAPPGTAGIAPSFREMIHAERQLYWRTTTFSSVDTWFWDRLQPNIVDNPVVTGTYTTTLPSPILSDLHTAIIRGEVVAVAYNDFIKPDHKMKIYFNDPDHIQPVIDVSWDGKSRYYFQAQVPQTRLVEDMDNLLEVVVEITGALSSDYIYFDWFEIEYDRHLTAVEEELPFSASQTGEWKYQISGFTQPDIDVLDVTNPYRPALLTDTSDAIPGTISFQVNREAGTQFYAGVAQELTEDQIIFYQPPNLNVDADYVYITHELFFDGVKNLLASYRETQGLSTLVIDVDDLYNQFNYGIYHPLAIKNFLHYAFSNWSMPPTYVLLVGDGHWNFHGSPLYDNPPIYMPPNLVWVDPWQGEVDSANLLANVVGDDPLADVLIGRLPINSNLELQNYYDKIIHYEKSGFQGWQRHFLFIADDTPDFAGNYVELSNQIISAYFTSHLVADKIYLDNYEDIENGCLDPDAPPSISSHCPKATTDIIAQLNNVGASVVNFIGHASLNLWTNEKIFTNQELSLLDNGDHLPVILSMTCLDGYWIHPNNAFETKSGQGLIEEMLRFKTNGAVAAFSPTGLGVASGHDLIHKGFYDSLFEAGVRELGAAAQAGKLNLYVNSSSHHDLLHTFTVFGDPALKIAITYRTDLPQMIK